MRTKEHGPLSKTLEEDHNEHLGAEDEPDAALILQFESAIQDMVQDDGELSAFFPHTKTFVVAFKSVLKPEDSGELERGIQAS